MTKTPVVLEPDLVEPGGAYQRPIRETPTPVAPPSPTFVTVPGGASDGPHDLPRLLRLLVIGAVGGAVAGALAESAIAEDRRYTGPPLDSLVGPTPKKKKKPTRRWRNA